MIFRQEELVAHWAANIWKNSCYLAEVLQVSTWCIHPAWVHH